MKNRIEKKLILKKKTVSNLNQEEMNKSKGGTAFELTCYCYTEHKSCSLGGNCCPPAEKLDNQTGYYC